MRGGKQEKAIKSAFLSPELRPLGSVPRGTEPQGEHASQSPHQGRVCWGSCSPPPSTLAEGCPGALIASTSTPPPPATVQVESKPSAGELQVFAEGSSWHEVRRQGQGSMASATEWYSHLKRGQKNSIHLCLLVEGYPKKLGTGWMEERAGGGLFTFHVFLEIKKSSLLFWNNFRLFQVAKRAWRVPVNLHPCSANVNILHNNSTF